MTADMPKYPDPQMAFDSSSCSPDPIVRKSGLRKGFRFELSSIRTFSDAPAVPAVVAAAPLPVTPKPIPYAKDKAMPTNPIRALNELRQAERDVEPVLGDVTGLAMDSAAGVYSKALKEMGVDTAGMPGDTLGATFRALRTASHSKSSTPGGQGFSERFPTIVPMRRM